MPRSRRNKRDFLSAADMAIPENNIATSLQVQYMLNIKSTLENMGSSLSPDEITSAWNMVQEAYRGDSLGNIHTILSGATKILSQLEVIAELIQEKWSQLDTRMKEKLIQRVGQIGKENVKEKRVKPVNYGLLLLWEMANLLCVTRQRHLVEMALKEHLGILTDIVIHVDVAMRKYILSCVDDIKNKNQVKLPSVKYLHDICKSYMSMDIKACRQTLLDLNKNHEIVKLTSLCLIRAYSQAVQSASAVGTSLRSDTLVDNMYTHEESVIMHLQLIQFLLKDGDLYLSWPRCTELWDTLIPNENGIQMDKNYLLDWFTECLPDLEADTQKQLLQEKLLSLPTAATNSYSFTCLQKYFEAVNSEESLKESSAEETDLIARGMGYLLTVATDCEENSIAERAINLLTKLVNQRKATRQFEEQEIEPLNSFQEKIKHLMEARSKKNIKKMLLDGGTPSKHKSREEERNKDAEPYTSPESAATSKIWELPPQEEKSAEMMTLPLVKPSQISSRREEKQSPRKARNEDNSGGEHRNAAMFRKHLIKMEHGDYDMIAYELITSDQSEDEEEQQADKEIDKMFAKHQVPEHESIASKLREKYNVEIPGLERIRETGKKYEKFSLDMVKEMMKKQDELNKQDGIAEPNFKDVKQALKTLTPFSIKDGDEELPVDDWLSNKEKLSLDQHLSNYEKLLSAYKLSVDKKLSNGEDLLNGEELSKQEVDSDQSKMHQMPKTEDSNQKISETNSKNPQKTEKEVFEDETKHDKPDKSTETQKRAATKVPKTQVGSAGVPWINRSIEKDEKICHALSKMVDPSKMKWSEKEDYFKLMSKTSRQYIKEDPFIRGLTLKLHDPEDNRPEVVVCTVHHIKTFQSGQQIQRIMKDAYAKMNSMRMEVRTSIFEDMACYLKDGVPMRALHACIFLISSHKKEKVAKPPPTEKIKDEESDWCELADSVVNYLFQDDDYIGLKKKDSNLKKRYYCEVCQEMFTEKCTNIHNIDPDTFAARMMSLPHYDTIQVLLNELGYYLTWARRLEMNVRKHVKIVSRIIPPYFSAKEIRIASVMYGLFENEKARDCLRKFYELTPYQLGFMGKYGMYGVFYLYLKLVLKTIQQPVISDELKKEHWFFDVDIRRPFIEMEKHLNCLNLGVLTASMPIVFNISQVPTPAPSVCGCGLASTVSLYVGRKKRGEEEADSDTTFQEEHFCGRAECLLPHLVHIIPELEDILEELRSCEKDIVRHREVWAQAREVVKSAAIMMDLATMQDNIWRSVLQLPQENSRSGLDWSTWNAPIDEKIRFCWSCYHRKKLFLCSRCRKARYCSYMCSKQHWEIHQSYCLQQHTLKSVLKKNKFKNYSMVSFQWSEDP